MIQDNNIYAGMDQTNKESIDEMRLNIASGLCDQDIAIKED